MRIKYQFTMRQVRSGRFYADTTDIAKCTPYIVVYLLRYPLAMLGKGKGGSLPRVCNLNSISTNETLFIFTCDLAGTVS